MTKDAKTHEHAFFIVIDWIFNFKPVTVVIIGTGLL